MFKANSDILVAAHKVEELRWVHFPLTLHEFVSIKLGFSLCIVFSFDKKHDKM